MKEWVYESSCDARVIHLTKETITTALLLIIWCWHHSANVITQQKWNLQFSQSSAESTRLSSGTDCDHNMILSRYAATLQKYGGQRAWIWKGWTTCPTFSQNPAHRALTGSAKNRKNKRKENNMWRITTNKWMYRKHKICIHGDRPNSDFITDILKRLKETWRYAW